MQERSEASRPRRKDDAIFHIGVVLIVVGLLASAATVGWNWSQSYPDPSELVPAEGRLERIHLESFRSRTAGSKWFVLDVAIDGREEGEPERWILPSFSARFNEPLASIEVGSSIEGLIERQERRIRGADHPVRVLWSIVQDGREVVPYSLVLEVEKGVRYNSPMMGLATSFIGAAILGLARAFGGRRS